MAAPPPVALTAAPARIQLAGAADETLLVANRGRSTAVVDLRQAGFALDLRGRPRIVVRRDASVRVTVRPARVALRPGQTASIAVSSVVGRYAIPGDHLALVVLATRPWGTDGIGVRMRLGVVVVVRVPGAVRHRLVARGVRLRRRALEVVVRNRGNVTEDVGPARLRVLLRRGGRVVAALRPARRELLPGADGIVELRLPIGLRGTLRAVVELRDGAGALTRRAFGLRVRAG